MRCIAIGHHASIQYNIIIFGMAYLNYAGCRQEVPVVGGAWSTPVDRVYVKPEIVDENFHFLFHRRFFFEIVFFHDSRSTHAKSILIKLFINPVPVNRLACYYYIFFTNEMRKINKQIKEKTYRAYRRRHRSHKIIRDIL